MKRAFLTIILLTLAGCTEVDRSSAVSLATAGESATSTLSSQASTAVQMLGSLDKWWAIDADLSCIEKDAAADRKSCLVGAGKSPGDIAAAKKVKQIVDLIKKRKQAVDALNQAYTAFADLAQYNPGQQATAALGTAYTKMNTFLSAASTLTGTPIAPLGSMAENAGAVALSVVADAREDKLILDANASLQKANDALYAGLNAESSTMTSLFTVLEIERATIYSRAFDAGLIAPMDVINPVYASAYPGVKLQANPARQDVLAATAHDIIEINAQADSSTLASTYADSLNALHALSAQHVALSKGKPIDLNVLESEISNIQANVAQITKATPSNK